ncbi:glycosyltransferase [Branchiibius sp. NY16-3462-2]|uniref:glycosyltransferase family 2 protein n=1 Tax=Branchiibius sp. NY16-3462-2 TaxID=1807500 RepID=UPI0025C63D12|nr:glycosyltransferase [Branchiibius sp. NY16-3462-2]
MQPTTVHEEPEARAVPSSETSHLVVAVPTLHRLDLLARALAGVEAARSRLTAERPDLSSEVLVVDNDPAGSAAPVASQYGAKHVVESRPGLAAVRNRALDEAAAARLLVFLDDDEAPDEEWLTALTDTWRSFGAQAVAGKVETDLSDRDADAWVQAVYERPRREDGQLMPTAATNNLLLDLDFVRRVGLRFDYRFGFSGGEDSFFTAQLVQAGGEIRWAEAARVVESVSGERLTRKWLLRRSVRAWATQLRVEEGLRGSGRNQRLLAGGQLAGQSLLRLGGGATLWSVAVLRRDGHRQGLSARTMARGVGGLLALTQFEDDEYRGRHG